MSECFLILALDGVLEGGYRFRLLDLDLKNVIGTIAKDQAVEFEDAIDGSRVRGPS